MNCGKFYEGECKKRSFSYFECVEIGHFKRDYPSLVHFGGSGWGTTFLRNQSGSRKFLLNKQVTTDSNLSIGRGSAVDATSHQG